MWAACGSVCKVWSIMRDKAKELSKGGTSQGIVNPSEKFHFIPRSTEEIFESRSDTFSTPPLRAQGAPSSM